MRIVFNFLFTIVTLINSLAIAKAAQFNDIFDIGKGHSAYTIKFKTPIEIKSHPNLNLVAEGEFSQDNQYVELSVDGTTKLGGICCSSYNFGQWLNNNVNDDIFSFPINDVYERRNAPVETSLTFSKDMFQLLYDDDNRFTFRSYLPNSVTGVDHVNLMIQFNFARVPEPSTIEFIITLMCIFLFVFTIHKILMYKGY